MSAPINEMIDKVVKPVPKPANLKEGDTYATHEGILKLGDIELEVFLLNTGQRIISEESLKKFFGDDFTNILSSIK